MYNFLFSTVTSRRHRPTLFPYTTLFRSSKRVFYPFYWYPETISWLRSLGLGEVVEARSGRRYSIDDRTMVAFVGDRRSTRLNSSHLGISYAVFCLTNKSKQNQGWHMVEI